MGNVCVGPSRLPLPATARPWSAIAIKAAQSGAPRLVPPTYCKGRLTAVGLGLIDRNTRVGVGVERDVRRAPGPRQLDRRLVTRFGLILAVSPAAGSPGRLGLIGSRSAQIKRGATDRNHVGRSRRVRRSREGAAVSTGRDESDPHVAGRRREIRVIRSLVWHLAKPPAHRHGHNPRRVPRGVDR